MISIYHNPRCSKSRQTLALLEDRGLAPNIILYLENPPDRKSLKDILGKLGITARQLLRKGEDAYRENNLADQHLTETQLIDAMVANPKLIERPIVINGSRAALGRPPENVLEIL
ncbi:arsenate reductase (glutaredoxin) [Porticoccus sp.]|uniref:arsenate reductase (glutaredoxin) n=1 Tax=Porticoccus sp. TaxID=2024853 RepID=UPI003F69FBCB